MNSRILKTAAFLVALGAPLGLGLTACESADFGAAGKNGAANGAGKRGANGNGKDGDATAHKEDANHKPDAGDGDDLGGADSNGYYYPVTPDLGHGGWVGKKAFPELQKAFGDDGGSGSDGGPNGPNGTDDAGGSGKPTGADDGNSNGKLDGDGGKSGGILDTGEGKSKDGVPGWENGEDGVFWVPCNGQQKGKIKGADGATVRVAGELCPDKAAQRKLQVLFVVDFSGSMEGNPFEGPNDPGTDCGRLRAAKALADKFSGDDFKDVDIQLGMVGFSTSAPTRSITFRDLQQFKSTLLDSNWCHSDAPTALTNYKDAFQSAQQALTGDADKVVYFISDGSPTVGGGGGVSDQEAGLQAAQNLRKTYGDKLVLNAVFLGYKNGDAQNPQGYLEQITGDPARVRVVGDADGLVKAIADLDTSATKITKSDVNAKVEAQGNDKPLGIDSLKKSKDKADAFIFMTESFRLVGKKGETVENTVEVTATTKDGKTLKSTAVIEYVVE